MWLEFDRLPRQSIQESNLLKLGVEIYSYNDHCSAPFSRAWLVWLSTTNSTRGREPTLSWNQLHSLSERMEAEVEAERHPAENNAGYCEPPFVALLRGEQPDQTRQSNGNECDGVSPVQEWWD